MTSGITLDAGGLIALERNDRRMLVLLAQARGAGSEVVIPATALAQVLRSPARQARLMRLLRQPNTVTMPLDRGDASFVGQLLASSTTSDIADAHVVICAQRTGHVVITSDPDDLHRLDSNLTLIEM